MKMKHRILDITHFKLVGIKRTNSFLLDITQDLWQDFMCQHADVIHRTDNNFYSIEEYPKDFFTDFSPSKEFSKWAAVKVNSFINTPSSMDNFIMPPGKYVVFKYKGNSSYV